jgi:hypothetical protein
MARAKKAVVPKKSNTEIRKLMLDYFYFRYSNGTSMRGKKGTSVRISDIKSAMKQQHGLVPQEVVSNLTYLLDQGWVKTDTVTKQFTTPRGTLVPSSTDFYVITSAGVDRIEGKGEFTMPKFHGINIQATGRNIITVGDGNQVSADFGDLSKALSDLRESLLKSGASEADKLNYVAEIETIQSQLAKPTPNKGILKAAWSGLEALSTIEGCAAAVQHVIPLITQLF